MGKFFLHKDGVLIQTGECPDGHEPFQSINNCSVGLGDPPVELLPYTPVEVDTSISIVFKRNQLLLESDWTQLPDIPKVTRAKWTSYRQALRDITKQEGYPLVVVWPTLPIE